MHLFPGPSVCLAPLCLQATANCLLALHRHAKHEYAKHGSFKRLDNYMEVALKVALKTVLSLQSVLSLLRGYVVHGAFWLLDIYMTFTLKIALDAMLSLQIFERFATSEWDLRILSGFLAADQLLGEPTRVVCCDYPPTHAAV